MKNKVRAWSIKEKKWLSFDSSDPIKSDYTGFSKLGYWVHFFHYDEDDVVEMSFTGFTDKNGKEIYEGDILSDEVETDEGIVKSKQQVFWNQPTGSWHLDNSYDQDKTCSTELWMELNDFKYEVVGNIYEDKTFKTQTSSL